MSYSLRVLGRVAVIFAAVTIFILFPHSTGAGAISSYLRIELEEDLLTLEARDTPLVQIVSKLGKLAGFKVVLVDMYDDPRPMDVTLERVPLEQAIKHLVRDTNRIIYYEPEEGSTDKLRIAQIWFLGSSSASASGLITIDENVVVDDLENEKGKIRSEAALKLAAQVDVALSDQWESDYVQARLIKLLQTDQDTLVRTRAAIALGAIGDDKAAIALELAVLDPHFSVSAQAINALGQIGTERAILALGSILLDGTADSTKRVMAAQALWKHNSEMAREYLRIGAKDEVKQVRMASSKPPPSLTKRSERQQLGPKVSE